MRQRKERKVITRSDYVELVNTLGDLMEYGNPNEFDNETVRGAMRKAREAMTKAIKIMEATK